MANKTGAFGLSPIRHNNGSPWNGATVECYIGSSYATALFIGDPVLISPTAAERDATAQRPTINASAGTDGTIIVGAIVEFEPLRTDLTKQYNPASTERIAHVCMDPSVVYEIRGDGGGTPTKNWIWNNAVMIATAAGDTTTGLSGFHLDEGTTTAPSADQTNPLLIVGISSKPDEELAASALYEVMLNTYWNAAGSVLGIAGA
jgi:hypothetical protein